MTNVTRLCAIVFPLKYHIHATSIKGKIVCAITLVLTVVFTIAGECCANAVYFALNTFAQLTTVDLYHRAWERGLMTTSNSFQLRSLCWCWQPLTLHSWYIALSSWFYGNIYFMKRYLDCLLVWGFYCTLCCQKKDEHEINHSSRKFYWWRIHW